MAKQRHSKAYHRYFENYAEREDYNEKGKRVITRVYTGEYYRADVEDSVWKRQKIVSAVLCAMALALFLYAGATTVASAVWYGAILTMGALIAVILLCTSIIHLLFAPREMEVRTWRDVSEQLERHALLAGGLLIACGIAYLIALFLEPVCTARNTLPQVFACGFAGCACLTVWVLAKRTVCRRLPPKHQRPEMSSPIRYEMPE